MPRGDEPIDLRPPTQENTAATSAFVGNLVDFLDESPVDSPLPSFREKLPDTTDHEWEVAPSIGGPGAGEACVWTVGVIAAHLVVSIGLFFAILVCSTIQLTVIEGIKDPELLKRLMMLGPTGNSILIAGEQWLMIAITILAVRLRMGPGTMRQLNLETPSMYQWLLVSCLVLPLGIVADFTYRVAAIPWKSLTTHYEFLGFIDQLNGVEQLQAMTGSMNLAVLILAIAVSPAISEELVFRGLFMRGMLPHLGVIGTMLVSSVLFAMIHIHPLHVVAVLPIGLALFWIYYTTRNFWLPMWLHYLNNMISVLVSRMGGDLKEQMQAPIDALVAFQVAIALVGGGLALWLLYRNRTRYRNSAGEEWKPYGAPMSSPPAALGMKREIALFGAPFALVSIVVTMGLILMQFTPWTR